MLCCNQLVEYSEADYIDMKVFDIFPHRHLNYQSTDEILVHHMHLLYRILSKFHKNILKILFDNKGC